MSKASPASSARKSGPCSYDAAVLWLFMNGDTKWIHDGSKPSEAATMLAHCWQRPIEKVTMDMKKLRAIQAVK